MTKKFRQAAQKEHHKYEFEDHTGKFVMKQDKRMHFKDMSEKEFIIEFFKRRDLQKYL